MQKQLKRKTPKMEILFSDCLTHIVATHYGKFNKDYHLSFTFQQEVETTDTACDKRCVYQHLRHGKG